MGDGNGARPRVGTLAIVGGGRMGEALIAGLTASGAVSAGAIRVAEPRAERREELASAYRVVCYESAARAVDGADTVIIAVKPGVVDAVTGSLAPSLAQGALVISVAAGITTARLESLLPAGTPVVRVMPNTPALVRAGMAVVSPGSEAGDADVALVVALFESLGRVLVVDERAQDACTAISGSGPAYFALVIDAIARAGVAQGLPREVAQTLAVQTMLGTAELIEKTGTHPEQVIDAVASPGGTTIAALERLEAHSVRAAFLDAVDAAVRRSRELGT